MMRPLLLASVLALLPALAARAACPPDEAMERLALRTVESPQGEHLSAMEPLADSRCAQDKPVARLSKQFGRPVACKVGLTNFAERQRFGVPHPVAGAIHALGTMTMTVADDAGEELARVPGTALLGHPLHVLPWLAEDLAKRGKKLQAGDFVSLGGLLPSLPAETGRRYTARYDGLPPRPVSASVQVT